MKLSLRRDIDAPAGTVFAEIASFDAIARSAGAKGVELRRIDDRSAGAAGAAWQVRVAFRGAPRQGTARVVTFEPDRQIAISAEFDEVTSLANVELMALSPGRTRLSGWVDLRPASMTGRVLIQSLKLARGSLQSRLERRVDAFAGRLEREAE